MLVTIFNKQKTVHDNKLSIQQFNKMDTYGAGTLFSNNVEKYFNLPMFNEIHATEQKGGKAITTVNMHKTVPFMQSIGLNEQGNELGNWIRASIYKSATELGIPYKPGVDTFYFSRAWANRIWKGTKGDTHIHGGACHMTSIFYYEVPENSSELIFINSPYKECEGVPLNKLKKNKTHTIKPSPGMLVSHNPFIPHAVGEHNNELPRTCFVFDKCFYNLPLPKNTNE